MKQTNLVRLSAVMLAAASGFPSLAHAQSNVVIYGLLDQGVEYVSGVTNGAGGTTHDTRVGTGAWPSRFGVRGREDLGGGLSAVFTIEQGVNVDVGTTGQGGRAWGRQALVGLSSNRFGALTFGRQYTARYWATNDADVFGPASQGLGVLDPGIPNARADNAIAYRGSFSGLHVDLNYSFGRDVAAGNNLFATNCPGETSNSKQCQQWAAALRYELHGFGAAVAYDEAHGGTSATWGGLTNPELTDKRAMVNGFYRDGDRRVGLGWLKRSNLGNPATPKSDLYWAAAAWPIANTSFVIDGLVAKLDYEDSPNAALQIALRGTYKLSKRTSVYLSAANMNNDGTLNLAVTSQSPAGAALPGGNQRSVIAGVTHRF